MTDSRAKTIYEKTKNEKNCYLLCGTITGSEPIPVLYELTDVQNAANWVKSGGSVWSPLSSNAQECITKAGYTPGGYDKTLRQYVPYIAEIHDLSRTLGFSFCHYHTIVGNSRVNLTVHSFFGLPVYGKFAESGLNLVDYN